ncbi:JmjC domain-containing histone demethylation protein 1 [Coemansia sp. RSA 552]|nr:JmjC domain-containing histone demethylation protein 1 [Coemansia sp. RSA 552]
MSSSSESEDAQACGQCEEGAPVEHEAYESWLQCDGCSEWVHGVCAGLAADEGEAVERFHCRQCVEQRGDSTGHDGELFNQFRRRLAAHEFLDDEFERMTDDVTEEWLRERDSNDPFIVNSTNDPIAAGAAEIANIVGHDTRAAVTDVLAQTQAGEWTLDTWTEYAGARPRRRVLRAELEVSQDTLGPQVQRPGVADAVDLMERYWPAAKRSDGRFPGARVEWHLDADGAYSDFRMAGGAAWTYWQVVAGAYVFYLVPPTAANVRRFEAWRRAPDRGLRLFAADVRQCFAVRVDAGHTLFVPPGWIHATSSTGDSLMLRGSFLALQSLNAHVGAFRLEERLGDPPERRFPKFAKLSRYMAELLARKWAKMDSRAKARWLLPELEGVFVLAIFAEALLAAHPPLRAHAARLRLLVADEASTRMTPDEWVNREQQLREGAHFRWIRPGMPQGSQLLAARPRRVCPSRHRRRRPEGESSPDAASSGDESSSDGASIQSGSDSDDSDASDASSSSTGYADSRRPRKRSLAPPNAARPRNVRQRIADRLKIKL